MHNQPNIFKFATSELSQDAVICWLVSHVNYFYDVELNKCAKEFVALLYNLKHKDTPIKGRDIKEITELQKQYLDIDVYFEASINGKRIPFIIEDKTYTTHHSGQLSKYKDSIIRIKKEDPICIYFKTGYIYPSDEKAKEEYGYEILDYMKLHNFFKKYTTYNIILKSYKQYIEEEFYLPYTEWPKLLEENKEIVEWKGEQKNLFHYQFIQWIYMHRLNKNCPSCLYTKGLKDFERIYQGKNKTGTIWTQLWFVKIEDAYGKDIEEKVFYRLDKKEKKGYYLSLRQYANIEDSNQKEKKRKRLVQFRELFQHASRTSPLSFGRVGNRGIKESEIAILYFKDNKPMQVLQNLILVHNNFIDQLKASKMAIF